jgi:two-component system, sporulation sensor kinase E
VVHNLLINAIEAVPRSDGAVTVRTVFQADERQVLLSVKDNGPGISQEQCALIFDPFHSSKGQGGTGLGLAAAQKIIVELAGSISVESELGTGTTFHVRLPLERTQTADEDPTHSGE